MDAKALAQAIASGLISVPVDFYLGVERTLQDLNLADGGVRVQRRNFNDDQRVYRALRNLYRDRSTLSKIAKIIINDALSHLPEPALRKIHDTMVGGATTLGSRFTLQLAISSYLGSKVVSGAMMGAAAKLFTRLGTGAMFGGVVLQGLISRACSASRRLQMSNPKLWQLLAINDYDMLYFLFEEPLKPITELSETLRKNPAKSEQFLREIENL